jgi:uncharacterized membrane protein
MGFFRRRAGDERGTVLVVVSIAMVVMIGSAALAVDIGQMTNKNRTLQAVADSVALDAARNVNGQNVGVLSAAGGAFMIALAASAVRNNFSSSDLTVEFGTMNPNWVAKTNSSDVPTAVRVTAHGSTKFAFRPGSASTTRSATALVQNGAGFSIGSWLASVPAGGDGVLNALFGDAFHLNAVSYNGLVNANLTLQQIGLNIPVTALSPTELLSTSVGIRDFMLASIAALTAQGNNAAAIAVLNSMIVNASLTGSVQLGQFMNVASGGETAAATASLNLLQLLTASAFVIEKNGGHALSIPTIGLTLPAGIASVTASATVIEPPKFYFGSAPGPTIETAQVRLSIAPVINLPIGLPPLVSVSVYGTLPIDITAAGATGNLAAINCGAPSIRVDSTTQAVNLNAALTLTVAAKVLFLVIDVARLTLAAGAKTTPASQSTTFNSPSEFWPNMTKSVGSSNLGLDGLLSFTGANVQILNGIINLDQISGIVVPAINTLLGGLDDALVEPLSKVLGVKFGGADIAAYGMACNGLRLAA